MVRIVCDVDGVLGDFVGALSEVLGDDFAPKEWDFIKDLPDNQREWVNVMMGQPWFWRTMPPIPCAYAGISGLRSAGHEVIFATAPNYLCKEWWRWRAEWLERRFNAKRGDCIAAERKELIVGDLLIDDKPANVEAWISAHPQKHALLYSHGYNKAASVGHECRVHDFTWDDIDRLLASLDGVGGDLPPNWGLIAFRPRAVG
jgi:5'(3')-deoxyribonucleotidase